MRIQLRRGSAAQWAADNPVLASGEPGYATDTGVLKIGDGSTAWNSLAAFGGAAAPSVSGLGLLGASLVDVTEAQVAYSLAAGLFVSVLVPLVAGQTVTKLGCVLDTAGVTSSGTNEMGLYSITGTTATRQQVTADMTAAFSGAAGYITGTLAASYTVPTSGLYAVTALTNFSGTTPKIVGSTTATSGQAFTPIHSHYPSVYKAAQASSPASFDLSTATRNSAAYYLTAE